MVVPYQIKEDRTIRTGATQSSPTNSPDVRATIILPGADDVYASVEISGAQARIITVRTDEQIWGGSYIIELDNSDGSLDGEDYIGKSLVLNFGFVGDSGSDLTRLWIHSQRFISEPGKLRLVLNCLDDWSLLAAVGTNVGRQYWNYPEQAPGEVDADAAQWDKTIRNIINLVITDAIGRTVNFDDDDGITSVQKPAMLITNARAGVRQALEFSKSFLLLKSAEPSPSEFHLIQPDIAPDNTEYSFNAANLFFNNVIDTAITIPNRITYYGQLTDGTLISGTATDSTSVTRLGFNLDRHYYYRPAQRKLLITQAIVDALAAGTLSKIQAERNQGMLIAPMHCSLELFDKIEIVDARFGTQKTVTGYVHRMIREYDRGVYRISIFVGGVASGVAVDLLEIPDSLPAKDTPQDAAGIKVTDHFIKLVNPNDWNYRAILRMTDNYLEIISENDGVGDLDVYTQRIHVPTRLKIPVGVDMYD